MYQQNPYQAQQFQQMPQQTGAFIQVPTEQDAYNWAVAPGNCFTFKIQNKPLVIEKSMGFSNLENPKIVRYNLVREEIAPEEMASSGYATRSDLDALTASFRSELDAIKAQIEKKPGRPKKEEVEA